MNKTEQIYRLLPKVIAGEMSCADIARKVHCSRELVSQVQHGEIVPREIRRCHVCGKSLGKYAVNKENKHGKQLCRQCGDVMKIVNASLYQRKMDESSYSVSMRRTIRRLLVQYVMHRMKDDVEPREIAAEVVRTLNCPDFVIEVKDGGLFQLVKYPKG